MNIQFKKGVLELCVLSLLEKEDRYGYDIAAAFTDKMDIAGGTVYPILRRLNGEGYVSFYLSEASGGPPRKYYTLTNRGRQFKDLLRREWIQFCAEVNHMIDYPGSA